MFKDIYPYLGREVKLLVLISVHQVTGWLNTNLVDINSQRKNLSWQNTWDSPVDGQPGQSVEAAGSSKPAYADEC